MNPIIKVELYVADMLSKSIIDSAIVSVDKQSILASGNMFPLDYQTAHPTSLYIQREGYQPLQANLDLMPDLSEPSIIRDTVYLQKFVGLPLTIYFDNDKPGRSQLVTTDKVYEDLYTPYYARKTQFINTYTNGLPSLQREQASEELTNFFEQEVQFGYMQLDSFSNTLHQYLAAGYKLDIVLEGYASPLANAAYNHRLTQRRIDCLVNHFEAWNNGAIMPFIQANHLIFTQEPYGEDTAPSNVTDNVMNRKEAIFGVAASKERRVRIIDIRKQPGVLTILNNVEITNKREKTDAKEK